MKSRPEKNIKLIAFLQALGLATYCGIVVVFLLLLLLSLAVLG
ncbi:MAG: hypothetical protein Q8P73_02750 [bacterium]|nr:hypothetical protein [bacterium]